MHRRTFVHTVLAPLIARRLAAAQADGWRTFTVTTRLEILAPAGATRAWLPLAQAPEGGYQHVVRQTWKGNAKTLRAIREHGLGILLAEWPEGEARPQVELSLHVSTRDRSTDWADLIPRGAPLHTLRLYLRPVRLDAGVPAEALRVARRESGDVARARAIYEWVIDHAGDAKPADTTTLFVGLARAAGVPARRVSGIYVAPGRAFATIGGTGDITAAQHARAEFHSARHGWVPVDPAAVRRLLRGTPAIQRSDADYARRRFFGAWEMNWIAFNDAENVRLPESAGPAVPFFMHPHAEAGSRRLEAPAEFQYRITSGAVEGEPR